MFLTVQQRILLTLLKYGPLQNSYIAKRVSITEQHCSNVINQLSIEGLIESEFKPPRLLSWKFILLLKFVWGLGLG